MEEKKPIERINLQGLIRKALQTSVYPVDSLDKGQLGEQDKFAYEKAREYHRITFSHPIPFYHAFLLYSLWNVSNNDGQDMSLQGFCDEIEEHTGKKYYPTGIKRILERVGLAPFRKMASMRRLTPQDKDRIDRAVDIRLPCSDIGNFIFLPEPVVVQYFNKRHKSRRNQDYKEICIVDRGRLGRLTFSGASRVYEAKDSGKSESGIVKYASINPCFIDEALDVRCCIEPQLIGILRKLYPGMDIPAGYIKKPDVLRYERETSSPKK